MKHGVLEVDFGILANALQANDVIDDGGEHEIVDCANVFLG